MDKFIENTVLTILAFAVMIGGAPASLILPNMLLLDQYNAIYVSVSTIAMLVITLVLYLFILAKVDPESTENPFTFI